VSSNVNAPTINATLPNAAPADKTSAGSNTRAGLPWLSVPKLDQERLRILQEKAKQPPLKN
jgi:hypothetical protein